MFACGYCSRSFARKDGLKRHGDCRPALKTCNICGGVFKSEGVLQRHMSEKYPTPKRPAAATADEVPHVPIAKRARLETLYEPSTSMTTMHCEVCNLNLPPSKYPGHLRSLNHREKCCIEKLDGVKLIRTSFRYRLATYRLESTEDPTNVKRFMSHLDTKIKKLVEDIMKKHESVKIGMELFGRFLLPSKETMEVKSFNTKFQVVNGTTDLEELCTQFREILDKKVSEFEQKESGWSLQQLLHLELCLNKYNPLKALSYIPLPKEILAKKAVLNIKNMDTKCFMWSVLAALYPLDYSRNPERVNHYKIFENELNFAAMDFPIELAAISKFEELNGISINVYELERVFKNGKNNIEVVGSLYFTKSRKNRHINLLLISDDYGNSHYCLIRNMSRLISSQLSSRRQTKYLCDGCLTYFYSDAKLKAHQEHDCNHVSVKLPGTNLRKDKYGNEVPENELKFEIFERKLKIPFVVYADFETVVAPIETKQNELHIESSYTIKTHKHEAYSFAYYIKCSFDDSLSDFKTYRGQDASYKFIEMLEDDCKRLYNKHLKFPVVMTALSLDQQREFKTATICHICEKPFNEEDKRVRDHCHLTGLFRGAAHSICNVNYKVPKFIPIFFHNLSGFDSHLLIKQLATEEEQLDVIAQNKERYIYITTLSIQKPIRYKNM